MGGGHGIGIKRNDYHRRNRRANHSTWSRSAGRNQQIEANPVTIQLPDIVVQKLPQSKLSVLAQANWQEHHPDNEEMPPIKVAIFTYVRHVLTNYDAIRPRTNEHLPTVDSNYLYAVQQVCNAIIDVYPWLRGEATKFYRIKAGFYRRTRVRVIKQPKTLTQTQLEEYNANEDEKWKGILAALEQEEIANEEYEVNLTEALSSLASERLLFFPPFLKKDEIDRRRFGSGLNNNDRWWEWEKELGVSEKRERISPYQGKLTHPQKGD